MRPFPIIDVSEDSGRTKKVSLYHQIIIALMINQPAKIFLCLAANHSLLHYFFYYFFTWTLLRKKQQCLHAVCRKQKAYRLMISFNFWMLLQNPKQNFTALCCCDMVK